MSNRFVLFRTKDDRKFLVDLNETVYISEEFGEAVLDTTTGKFDRETYLLVNGTRVTATFDEVYRIFGSMQLSEGCSCK